jgi:hypothetical protein
LLAICFAPSLADSFTFLTLTWLVVVIIFENFSFALFTPPLGDFQRLWQEKRATLRLRHNDRVKRGTPRHSISYPFPFPLSLSYNRVRERGIPRKGSFSVKETGPEPPY